MPLQLIGYIGHPKIHLNVGGPTAHPEVEEHFEDARDNEIDSAGEARSTVGEEVDDHQSQDERSSRDGSMVRDKPFQFTSGVQLS